MTDTSTDDLAKTIAQDALGISWSDTESAARRVAEKAAEREQYLTDERDALRAQLAAAQAQVQTARKQDVKIVVKLMAKYAAEKGSTKTPAGRTALFYGRKMSDAILALIDKEPTP